MHFVYVLLILFMVVDLKRNCSDTRIIMAIAFSLLVAGTLSNGKARRSCGISHHRFLSIGGILCFIHGLFSVSYYISATATIQEDKKLNQQGGHA